MSKHTGEIRSFRVVTPYEAMCLAMHRRNQRVITHIAQFTTQHLGSPYSVPCTISSTPTVPCTPLYLEAWRREDDRRRGWYSKHIGRHLWAAWLGQYSEQQHTKDLRAMHERNQRVIMIHEADGDFEPDNVRIARRA